MWTDPPYGVSYVGKTKNKLTIQNDGAAGLEQFLLKAFSSANAQALADGAAVYVAHPAGVLQRDFTKAFVSSGWRIHQTLVWVKDSMVMGHSDYHYRHEPILFGYKLGKGRRGRGGAGWYGDNSQTSIFEVPRPKASEEHPTMKPPALVGRMIGNSCPKGGLVFDPFLGSGTTP
jgi:DNA modification methylase